MVDNCNDEEDIEDNNGNSPSYNYILDLQAGHGSYIADMIYARAVLEASREVASVRQ